MQHTSAIPGYQSHTASTEVPLEMLAACHGRIERQCQTLQKLHPHLQTHGCDVQAQQAAKAVIRYFDSAARDHHTDEEEDLFPNLLESMAGSDAVCLKALVSRLIAEHRELEHRWDAMRPKLVAIGEAQDYAANLTLDEVEEFVASYAAHILTEETELLPMAQRLLDDAAISRIGRAMRRRRGFDFLPGS